MSYELIADLFTVEPVKSCSRLEAIFDPFVQKGSFQFFHRIPEMSGKIDYGIIFNFDSLVFQQLLHGRSGMKMNLPSQESVSVHYPVRRNERLLSVRKIQSPSYHPG